MRDCLLLVDLLNDFRPRTATSRTAIDAREDRFKVTVIASAGCAVDLELEEVALAYLERMVGVRVVASLVPVTTAGDPVG